MILKLNYNGFEKTIKEKNISITLKENNELTIENQTLKKILFYILTENEKELKNLETKIKDFPKEKIFINLEIILPQGKIYKTYNLEEGLIIKTNLNIENNILKNNIIVYKPFLYKFLSPNILSSLKTKLLEEENKKLEILNNQLEELKNNTLLKQLEELEKIKIIIRKNTITLNNKKFNFKNFEDLKEEINKKTLELLSKKDLEELENELSFYFKLKLNLEELEKIENKILNEEKLEDFELSFINKLYNYQLKKLKLLLENYPVKDVYEIYQSNKKQTVFTKEELLTNIENLKNNKSINLNKIEENFITLFNKYQENLNNNIIISKLLENYELERQNYFSFKEEYDKILKILNLDLEFNFDNIKVLQSTLKEEKLKLQKDNKILEEEFKILNKKITDINNNIKNIEKIYKNLKTVILPQKYLIYKDKCYIKTIIDEKEYEIPIEEGNEKEIQEFIDNLKNYNIELSKKIENNLNTLIIK